MSQRSAAQPISAASAHLCGLARRIAAAYIAHTPVRAAILVGSASTGESDAHSDIDMGVLYDALPPDEAVAAARAALGSTENEPQGERGQGGFAEAGYVDGVEVEVGHGTLAAWETT
jgi:hypothetical protein